MGTKVEQKAINLPFDEQERFQLVAASVNGRMSPAINQYLEANMRTDESSEILPRSFPPAN